MFRFSFQAANRDNRSSRRATALAAGFTLALLGGPRRAQAAGPEILIRLDLRAPAECPSADAFLGEVLKRVPHARAATPAEGARSFRASIERRGARFFGSVESDSLTQTQQKVAEADSCRGVVDALAVSVALSLDADESTGPAAASSVDQAAPPSRLPAPAVRKAPVAVASSTPLAKQRWGVAVDLAMLGSALPLLSGAEASFFWHADRRGLLSPTLRVGASGLHAFRSDSPVELTSLLWTTSLCPSRAVVGGASFSICARNILGGLRGRARLRSSSSGAWLLLGATGAEARVELSLGRWLLEGGLGALGVWSRPTFRTEPSGTPLQTTSAVMLDAGVGIGAFF